MGWRYRKSINLGLGFRINLSKSGIGYSWGVPGYRVTKMANGGNRTTYSLPGTGISYVEQSGKNSNREDMLYTGETENFKNIPIEEVQKNDPILNKINKVVTLNRFSNIILFLTLGIFYHPAFIMCLFGGIGIKIYISLSKKIGLYYEFDNESRKMYDSLKEVLIKLSKNKKMWQVTSSTKVYNTKYNAGAGHNIDRNNAYITSKMPWYIKTNIDVYGLNLRNQKLFFTPDRVIVFRPFRKAFGCAYNDMKLLISYSNFVESQRVYSDSEIVDYTWRYANRDGGRDLRFSGNRKFPICKYGELTIESPYGINTIIHFSNFNLAYDIKTDLILFGNEFNKILAKSKNKETKELKEESTNKKEEVKEQTKNDKIEEKIESKIEKIEYKIPSITIVKDAESQSFIDICKEIKSKKELMIPIGSNKDEKVFEKLSTMPNMLIGGTVMSGKTAYINSIISSVLLTKKPDEIKMIIFDSKKVDYSIYNGVPHLMIPIINDPKKLNIALQKISIEIRRRMDLLNQANVKNITQYNNMLTEDNSKIPDVLIVIDDLTNLNGLEEINNEIEDISLNGWNVNVYMIVSANHPSARVISTISKSNFPSRLSFKVTNAQASKIIINDSGAEKLTGLGNALYVSRMIGKPIKVVVPFITDDDIKNIVNKWIEQGKTYYPSDYTEEISSKKMDNEDSYEEPLYDEIVEFVVSTGKASASLLQRRFKLGYNRAARCIDLLEERGIVGPSKGDKPRDVLVKFESDGE